MYTNQRRDYGEGLLRFRFLLQYRHQKLGNQRAPDLSPDGRLIFSIEVIQLEVLLHFFERIMWPGGSEYKVADGFHFWPDGIDDNDGADNFVKAFKLIGYNNCVSFEYEPGYQKIALYVEKGTTKCTHAARGLQNGKWTSKLGSNEDIQHGTPYFLESIVYGEVYCFMKRIFK